ncbi:MAG: protein phosphatase 2C domain-containing protein [Candidatus Pelagadaptatus aseana]|uniref:PP2C family protein-serine/threonine phosphatase n=1 Tax=Candidatus Pelagadaptatus aseana TaxID=3120508 RepID=UPI0039B15A96
MPPLQSYSITDKGLQRPNNEDCYLSTPDLNLWLVADGMGGHEAGEVASAITRDTISEQVEQGNTLEQAILMAHTNVMQAIESGQGGEGMGSTVVALHNSGTDYDIAWVGDSRAYVWSITAEGGQLDQLTTDHSYVQMLLESGSIAAEEMETHPEKNVITQCIGSFDNPNIQVDTLNNKWRPNQWILLCSDGLTDELSNQEIAEALCHASSIEDAGDKLIAAALDHGGKDNVTVQLIASPQQHNIPRTTLMQSPWIILALLAAFGLIAALAWWL